MTYMDNHGEAVRTIQAQLDEIEGLNDQCDELEFALQESLKLQSHYAGLLNMYDGGKRRQFGDVEVWLNRLRELAPNHKLKPTRSMGQNG